MVSAAGIAVDLGDERRHCNGFDVLARGLLIQAESSALVHGPVEFLEAVFHADALDEHLDNGSR
jgi:hypothetical protein